MLRASRPKPPCARGAKPLPSHLLHTIALWGGVLLSAAAWAQSPLTQSYATRDGRAPTFVLACVSTDGTFSAQPCGVSGYPVHVVVDSGGAASGAASSTPTTAPGTASAQLIGIQGGGANALPVAVSDSAVAQVVVQTQLAAAALGTPNDAAATSAGTVVAQLRRIAALLAATPNGAINADGGQQVHVTNLPAIQATAAPDVRAGAQSLALGTVGTAISFAVNGQATLGLSFAGVSGSNATLLISGSGDGGATYINLPTYFPSNPAQYAVNLYVVGNTSAQVPTAGLTNVRVSVYVAGAGTAVVTPSAAAGASVVAVANLPTTQAVSGTVSIGALPAAARSAAWTDASTTATATAAVPPALAATTGRVGLHVWNLGAATACLNYTAAAAASGSGCAAGSVPIAPGSAYLEDQPGNVSPEAVSLVCTGASCPLTIKVR